MPSPQGMISTAMSSAPVALGCIAVFMVLSGAYLAIATPGEPAQGNAGLSIGERARALPDDTVGSISPAETEDSSPASAVAESGRRFVKTFVIRTDGRTVQPLSGYP